MEGEEIKKSIYEPKRIKYNKKDDVHKIEKIVRKKRNKCLIKWLGYPEEYPT